MLKSYINETNRTRGVKIGLTWFCRYCGEEMTASWEGVGCSCEYAQTEAHLKNELESLKRIPFPQSLVEKKIEFIKEYPAAEKFETKIIGM